MPVYKALRGQSTHPHRKRLLDQSMHVPGPLDF